MDIGRRLRRLRETKGLSQGDVEKRSGLMRAYISRVEGGYTVPSLANLERFSRVLEVEPYQLLFDGEEPRAGAEVPEQPELTRQARRLVTFFEKISSVDRKLLLRLASKLAKS